MKKRSAAKRHKQPVFFIDRSLGKIDVPTALRANGYCCELHDDCEIDGVRFDQDTEDEVWLKAVAVRDWIVLTKDERIRYRPAELGAIQAAGLRAFIVIAGNVRGAETANILLKAMPKIIAAALSRKGPCVYYVYKDSTIKRIR
ncbi:MAG TPA: hypothetical protein VNH18_08765 [Bryobacteraceae bacterium]|nr:hypothetical protein [Bryobacteraceae bacterium]